MNTVLQMFERTCATFHNSVALVECDGITTHTWSDYRAAARRFAKSLVGVGLQPGDAVNIIGFNAPQWMVAHLGTLMAGGVGVGVYATNSADTCHYIAKDSGARVAVCEGADQMRKYLRAVDDEAVPTLVVYGEDRPLPEEDLSCATQDVHLWDDFLALGSVVEDSIIDARSAAQAPESCCSLIYTSGTTGPPKGVMISHNNAVWTARLLVEMLGTLSDLDRIVSYLPLSHVAAQLLDIYCAIAVGASVHFARSDALKGSLVSTLKAVRPTIFFGVPRVWEKMREGLLRAGSRLGSLQRQVGAWAKDKGAARSRMAQFGQPGGAPCGFGCAHNLVLSRIKRELGLDEAKACFTGAAPIDREVLDYFGSLDIPVYELYGQSECTGPHSVNLPGRWRLGSCGRPLTGVETRVDPETQEIQIRGPHVFLGYRGKDSPRIDGGWLPTGDMGRVDEDGFLYITGRIKDLIITAGGENVPPTLIEASIQRELPCLTHCVVVGDRRKYLAALLACPAEDGVLPAAACAQLGLEANTTLDSDAFKASVQRGIDTANARATSSAQTIKRWAMLPGELTLENQEITPTLKVRRQAVCERHADLIASLYRDPS